MKSDQILFNGKVIDFWLLQLHKFHKSMKCFRLKDRYLIIVQRKVTNITSSWGIISILGEIFIKFATREELTFGQGF